MEFALCLRGRDVAGLGKGEYNEPSVETGGLEEVSTAEESLLEVCSG